MESQKMIGSNFLDDWRQHHLKKGYTKFIYDGIVNETLWKNAKPKICFFLKEAYLKENTETADLCKWFNENDLWRMWWVVSDWIYGIENTTTTAIPAFDEEKLDKTELANKRIRSTAVINIKKSNGETNSKHEDLLAFAKDDREFIKKQFEQINPEIIVCGNTGYYFEIIFTNWFMHF